MWPPEHTYMNTLQLHPQTVNTIEMICANGIHNHAVSPGLSPSPLAIQHLGQRGLAC